MHGNSTWGLLVQLSLSQTSKNAVFLIISYVFSSIKSKNKKREHVMPGRRRWGGPNNVHT
jgi:hypothetical protein